MAHKTAPDETAPEQVAIDTQTGIFPEFRRLWNGGEHRRAADLAQAERLTEAEWAALHDEFPGILEVINQ